MNRNSASDSKIIEEVLAGQTRAYEALMHRYQHMVYTLAMRMLGNPEIAEETTQDVFLKVYRALGSFRGESKFSTWLYKIAYRRILDAVKKENRKTSQVIACSLNELNTGSYEATWDTIMASERKEMLTGVLNLLTPEENSVLSLYYLQELSIKEISEITGLGKSTVKVRLFRAREHLKVLLVDTTQGALLKTHMRNTN